ncbi:DEAD/DEAH box helicase [candidate division KSB1 bacterium]|nr:DEAD/DEAH box helicase [candidate division KSB1 bacterium]
MVGGGLSRVNCKTSAEPGAPTDSSVHDLDQDSGRASHESWHGPSRGITLATVQKLLQGELEQLLEVSEGDALPEFTAEEREAFVALALSGLIDSSVADNGAGRKAKYEIYTHQAAMLKRGVCEGQPGVVTSGTGSGKTESFLLPILASLAKEAMTWPVPAADYMFRRWWQEGADREPMERLIQKNGFPTKTNPLLTPFVPHREGEDAKRPAAVRALILYPMNALVEDQLVRLRRALDSSDARNVMDERFSNNRIFFGRYTSATPVTGFDIHPRLAYLTKEESQDQEIGNKRKRKLEKLFEQMKNLQTGQRQAEAQALEELRAELVKKEGLGQAIDPSLHEALPLLHPFPVALF